MSETEAMTSPFAYQGASPLFVVSDLTIATTFYCGVLGFEKKWSWGDPVVRVGIGPKDMAVGNPFEIHLIDDPTIGPSGTSFVFFHVVGVEALYRRCQTHGADIYLELGDRPWGLKDFRIADPFGNRMGFGETI
ncbi:MAG: hypothetical protein COA47_00870 [Robiginitomaculum sp.]|nr:MAG: hypothetical protein COA47_00870 [Robiginitomaculum sp.]